MHPQMYDLEIVFVNIKETLSIYREKEHEKRIWSLLVLKLFHAIYPK